MNKTNVIGPFTEDEWYTMSALRKDLAFLKKKLSEGEPDVYHSVVDTEKKLNKYLTKQAA